MRYIEKLLQDIETTREQMYRAYKNDPTSPDMLALSRTLDELLNEFNRYLR
ncbi:hypothetical protein GCM10008983_14440 [Lentibacillus halophilus]|uniref:Spo0E like sporulation regulatory protein n=1 Tax=Lentibacillus halophilus TaxID=295065 RepID=A0ABN0Z8Z8_9BACI